MKANMALLAAGCVAFLMFTVWRTWVYAGDEVLPPGQQPVIVEPFPRSQIITTHIPPHRLAIDLEVVGNKFYVLWNDGNVTTAIPEALRVEGCPEDIDGDGVVAIPDLLDLIAAMGKKCP
ncbi:MAG: hypothetical protein V3S55_09375 [Nitrospiraceae bacterium]